MFGKSKLNNTNGGGEDKFLMVKIVGALIIFTGALLYLIIQFTGESDTVSGGSFVSGEVFRQKGENSAPEKKPMIRAPSTQMNKKDSIDLFEKTNESYFAAQRKEAEAQEAERKARLTGKKTAKQADDTESQQPAEKKTRKKKQETVIPRMQLDSGNGGSSGGQAAAQGQMPAGMPDLSKIQGANGQVDQEQLQKLMQNAGKGQ